MAEAVPVKPVSITSYEADFYAWTQEQARFLRTGQWEKVDLANVIEEIDSLGRQQEQELENWLGILFGHLLKWQFQPEHRCNSWEATLREQRRRISKLLKKNPSLKPYLTKAMLDGFQNGRDLAIQETNLAYATFPETCPYSFEQALDDNFLPD